MTSLTHRHLHVRDRTVAATVYADWLGMRVKRRGDALTFMTGDDGFDLASMDDPAPAPMPPWFHFGFRLASPQAVIDLLERMQAADVVLAKPLYQDPTLVSLTTTDLSTGKSVSVSRNVCSSDTTSPTVSILSPVQGASYSKLPTLDVKVTDAVDKDIKQIRVSIGETAAFPLNANGRVGTQITPRRTVGNMIETQITVTATDASSNTTSSSVTILLEKSLR